MKVGVYTNYSKDKNLSITQKAVNILNDAGYDSCCFSKELNEEQNYSGLDCLVVIGGDGTILYNAVQCMKADIPILTINKGTFGFLSEVPSDNLDGIIDLLNLKNAVIEERNMLKTHIKGRDYYALNEFMIARNSLGRIITVGVEVDGHLINEFKGDGFIVGTPTGSTGYSLSAGGSIISPKAKVITLTPLNCTSLTARPIIVDQKESVRLIIIDAADEASVVADGKGVAFLKEGEHISVNAAEKSLKFIRHNGFSFYRKLIKRLS